MQLHQWFLIVSLGGALLLLALLVMCRSQGLPL